MAHLALYRKYRPSTFEEMVGQEAVVTALQNQVKYGQVGHAYLFCGVRGTGKTSAAKVFARAVNCLHPVDGNPCNECELCVEAESSFNTVEIDAASNNGVESIRSLCEEVQYAPAKGTYKVYIIDEVHMLTPSAFNALLKTLEEPPAHIIFILATTEPHKVLPTIVSRCQRYDFKRISAQEIAVRLRYVCDQEKIDAEDEALFYIASLAEGGMRDALSVLDQCHAYYINEKVTLDKVQETLGAVDGEILTRMTQALKEQNAGALLAGVEEVVMQGRDLLQFVLMWNTYLRNMLISKTLPQSQNEVLVQVDSAQRARILQQMAYFTVPEIASYIEELAKLEAQIRTAAQKRIVLEVGLIRLLHLPSDVSVSSVSSVSKPVAVTPQGSPEKQEPSRRQEAPKVVPVKIVATGPWQEKWPKICQNLMAQSGSMASLQFMVMQQGSSENELILISDKSIYVQQLQLGNGEKLRIIENELEKATGRRYQVRAMLKAGQGGADLSDIRKQIHTDVNWRN